MFEAEVGPIKYIAEFVYGEKADRDLLDRAVRWVIITIIFVFDPLAVLLLIAANISLNQWRDKRDERKTDTMDRALKRIEVLENRNKRLKIYKDLTKEFGDNPDEIKLLDSEKAFKDTMNKVKYKIEKAEGGIIAGASSGPPPKSGPTPHGLPYVAKNVRPIKERR